MDISRHIFTVLATCAAGFFALMALVVAFV
jgi:hypothetical protein